MRGARGGSHAPTGEPIDWVVGQAALSATVQFQKGHETFKRSTSGLKPASICIDYEALVESATCCGVNLAAAWTGLVALPSSSEVVEHAGISKAVLFQNGTETIQGRYFRVETRVGLY